ncbi:MAG: protein phosphatase 2C domain-containing protein [Gallionella sp.]|nr:protein phosphatase 2C domain-containing protein [Gallionella sp.]
MNFTAHQLSHIGDRKYNQDRVAYAYTDESLLLVLADGMGGHLNGEWAAETAVATFVEAFGAVANPKISDPQKFLADVMKQAHRRIMAFPLEPGTSFPGTTCVAALAQDGKVYWGHAGDSRFYLMRDGKIAARTLDHSAVGQWLELGIISEEEARTHPQRNQITNCLGGYDDIFYIEPGKTENLRDGDVLFLGSDGLWSAFTDREVCAPFTAAPPDIALENLLRQALKREAGHSDNLTGLVVRWGRTESFHPAAVPIGCVLEIH